MNLQQELKDFEEFKKQYQKNFAMKLLKEKDGQIFYNQEIIKNQEGNITARGADFINVGYKLKGAESKALSNLFRYTFTFRGKKVESLEAIFQALKFIDPKEQNLVLDYFGLDANNIKIASSYDWKQSGILYWQGEPIKRNSSAYEHFVNEMYISAIQNPLYRNMLKNLPEDMYIMHSIGEEKSGDTVFTRYEFELQLNCLKSFLRRV